MPDTPASIISLNFDPKGLAETQKGAKDLESTFGRIGGIAEGLGKSLAGLAGVAGIGAIVHDFMRIETAATRTALAVNNIRGGSGMMGSLLSAQQKTGVDAVDLAGGVRASQQFAGGRFLSSNRNAGSYATFLGHASQATGLDATALGALLGQGLSIQGQGVSQQGAQGLLSQAYTASARAGQGGMTGDFLQALTGLVSQTGFFGGGRNRGGMAAAMGAAMKGDAAFANPSNAAGAIGSVESVLQGSLSNPRMMAALQMSGANINDILSGDFSAAQKLAKFAKGQGPLASKLFFYNSFGQQGGRLMEDLANGKVNPQEFKKRMEQERGKDPQQAMKQLMDRASQQEHTAASELKQIEATLIHDVAGPLKEIEKLLGFLAGAPEALTIGAGVIGGLKLGKGINKFLNKRAARNAAKNTAEDVAKGAGEAVGKGAAERSLALRALGKLGGGPLVFGQEMLFPDKWFSNLTGGDLSDGDWVGGEFKAVRRKLGGMKPGQAEKYLKQRIQHYTPQGLGRDVTDQDLKIQTLLQDMLKELQKQTDKGGRNQGASFMPGAGSGGASGIQMAAWVALAGGAGGGGGGSGMSFASFGGGGGGVSLVPGSFASPGGGGGGGNPGGGGWKDCTLTWYDPALGGMNSGDGSKDPHHKTSSGEPYDPSAYTCAAPSSYAFGTMIEFSFGGKQITCRVNDRGGAIQGNHFDLSRAAGKALGIGNSKGKFRVSGGSAAGKKGGDKKQPSSSGGPHAVTTSAGGGGGGDFGGMALGGGFPSGGGHSGTVNVYLDNRLIDKARHRTRAM
jgi:3D (Asp-Asp-Asp) domain-containing protein